LLRHFQVPEQLWRAATSTRRWSPVKGPGRRPIPSVSSCTAQGLSCPRAYAWGGGLLPRHFTLACSDCSSDRSPEPGASKRFVFCDTFRRKELSFSAPLLSQGGLPCGVRTFLSSFFRPRSDRPPITSIPAGCDHSRGRSYVGDLELSKNGIDSRGPGIERADPRSVLEFWKFNDRAISIGSVLRRCSMATGGQARLMLSAWPSSRPAIRRSRSSWRFAF
jgi:hypothetical protein